MQLYTVYFIWKLLYMFRVVPPPIFRSANNCIYSIWYYSHRNCYLPLSWKSWNWFECAVGGVSYPQHTQTSSNASTISADNSYGVSNPLNAELNPICYLLALLAHHFLHVSRIRVKSLTLRLLSYIYVYVYIYIYIYIYIYGAPILDVSRSHTTTQHSR